MKRGRQVFEIDYNYCPTCKNNLAFITKNNRQNLHCNKCGFTFWNNPKPVVSALITHKGKTLLIQRNQDSYKYYWSLPGGIIDYLESPEEALTREILEEVNLTVKSLKLIDTYLIIYAPTGLSNKPSHTSIDLVYSVKVNEKLTSSLLSQNQNEVRQIKLFHTKELPAKIAFGHRNIIHKFVQNHINKMLTNTFTHSVC